MNVRQPFSGGSGRRSPHRRLAAVFIALVLAAGCAATAVPSASQGPIGSAPTGRPTLPSQPTLSPTVTASPEPTPSPSPTPWVTASPPPEPAEQKATWETTGSMRWSRVTPTAVLLGNGSVLVLGDEGGKYEPVPEDSRYAEVWNPSTGRWHAVDRLPTARGEFAAVTLKDGRALVAGGTNAEWVSYSSAYVFDPGTERWTKVGLMGTARSSPAAAVLPDGRVLIAGGGYCTGVATEGRATGIALALYRGSSQPESQLADLWPGPECRALATAEIYDPSSGTWSRTGNMRYAGGGTGVTVGDGRVLVAGVSSVEIYDPTTGRFSLAEPLPPLDAAALERIGVPSPEKVAAARPDWAGTLVALPDGDAMLIGTGASSEDSNVTRTLRWDLDTGQWTEVGDPFVSQWDENLGQRSWGTWHPDAVAVVLEDGRVVTAGGYAPNDTTDRGTRRAQLLDPATGVWRSLPRMPSARIATEALLLTDGSVLVVGGYNDPSDGYPRALSGAFRLLPPG